MLIVGIDPGKKGAVTSIVGDEIHSIDVMGDVHWFGDHLESLKKYAIMEFVYGIFVYIEKAQPMPKNGAVSMFNYGVHYGELLGTLVALSIPFETVPPTTWTKVIHQTKSKTMTAKEKTLQAIQRLYPNISLVDPESERAKKPHEGIVDALAIMEYGRRQCQEKKSVTLSSERRSTIQLKTPKT